MDGVETYKRIKKIQNEVVVVMMTAYSVDELIQEALKEGAYDILYKPVDFEKLISLIEIADDKRKGGFILIVDDAPEFNLTFKKNTY